MESLLERGEKLDDLVSKSEVLGTQSKAFYKTVSSAAWPPRVSPPIEPLQLVLWHSLFNQGWIGVPLLGVWESKVLKPQ